MAGNSGSVLTGTPSAFEREHDLAQTRKGGGQGCVRIEVPGSPQPFNDQTCRIHAVALGVIDDARPAEALMQAGGQPSRYFL